MKENINKIEETLKPFREIDVDGKDRAELLDEFILAFDSSDLDTEKSIKYVNRRQFISGVFYLIGTLFTVFAIAVIFVPLPKPLEMGTLYYFNPNDGITVSDVIALAVLLAGLVMLAAGIVIRSKLQGK